MLFLLDLIKSFVFHVLSFKGRREAKSINIVDLFRVSHKLHL